MTNNIAEFFWLLGLGASKHNLGQVSLGEVSNYPLYLLQPRISDPTKPNLLIAAGFHGDEIAGPWGVVFYLNRTSKLPCNISFLPLANPTGFCNNSRYNAAGKSPNDGWIHENSLSEEGQIIKGHIEKILPLAKDGFLTLHEGLDHRQFYLYCMGDKDDLIESLIETGGEYFGIVEDGYYTQKEESLVKKITIKKGLVHNIHDGTFEDYLFHQGIPQTICTETPQKAILEDRVSAVMALIDTFVTRKKRML